MGVRSQNYRFLATSASDSRKASSQPAPLPLEAERLRGNVLWRFEGTLTRVGELSLVCAYNDLQEAEAGG